MPILVLIVSTALFWFVYWFVRMGGIEHVGETMARRKATIRTAQAREAERVAPLRAVDDARDAAVVLMVLMARVDRDPSREHVAKIEGLMRDVFGFDHEVTPRLTQARFIASRADRFEEAAGLLGDLLNKALTRDEKRQLVGMVEEIARVDGPSMGQTEAVTVLERRLGLLPAY